MSVLWSEVRSGVYYDSIVLMQLQSALKGLPGVADSGVTMATATNLALLEANGLDIVTGPSERGVITLRFVDEASAERRDAIIESMRNDGRVLFAQPVASED